MDIRKKRKEGDRKEGGEKTQFIRILKNPSVTCPSTRWKGKEEKRREG